MDAVILTTCPRDCYDACGVMVDARSDPHEQLADASLLAEHTLGFDELEPALAD